MRKMTASGLAIAALLTGCGANDHPEELKGVWSTGCQGSTIETYAFEDGVTLTAVGHSGSGCAKRTTTMKIRTNAAYETELRTTSSGVEALKADLTLAGNITFEPHDEFSLASLRNTCPNLSWALNVPTSINNCGHISVTGLIAQFKPSLQVLLYVDGNNLYLSGASTPKDENGTPLDVEFNKAYIKQN